MNNIINEPKYNILDKEIIMPDDLTEVKNRTFENFKNLTSVQIPDSVQCIGHYSFYNCENLKEIKLPYSLLEIRSNSFYNCKSLEKIIFNDWVYLIDDGAFHGCESLKSIKFPNSIGGIGKDAFMNCSGLKEITFNYGIEDIKEATFMNCSNLESVNLSSSISKIKQKAFFGCTSLKEIDLSNINLIGRKAFCNCKNLSKVFISNFTYSVGDNCFKNCNLNYIYQLNGDGTIYLSNDKPLSTEDCSIFYDMNEIKKYIFDFDCSKILGQSDFENFKINYPIIKENKLNMPISFYYGISNPTEFASFVKNSTFKFFNNEISQEKIKNLLDFNIDPNGESSRTYAGEFYKLAYKLGCFSNERILDENGNPTDTRVGQKASSLLSSILKSHYDDIDNILNAFNDLPLEDNINQNFLNFITKRGKNKSYENFELLLELEKQYPEMIAKVAENFDVSQNFLTGINKEGQPIYRSHKDAFIKFYSTEKFNHVNKENMYIAEFYLKQGITTQKDFDIACETYESAKNSKVRKHILEKPLKENSTINSIEQIKSETEDILYENKKILTENFNKSFTYEMLDKSALENGIIGIYCSCCATLTSGLYGRDIAEATILENNVQNMVIRDSKGEIIAKGALYVNEEYGYGVFNDFELNEKYKEHENKLINGYYDNTKSPQLVADRETIFNAFMRGIKAFAKEYDKEHPDKPLLQVNVGMGFNRLSELCDKYPIENNMLNVPDEFEDAANEQRILYKKDETLVKNNDEVLNNN